MARFARFEELSGGSSAKGELGVVKLWMGGYSRGAAVANLLLATRVNKELSDWNGRMSSSTFATPVALGPQDYPGLAGLRQQPQRRRQPAERELGREQHLQHHLQRRHRAASSARRVELPPNGNDRFLPSTRNEEELEDLNEMGQERFRPTPLDFSWLATDKETNEVMLSMEEYFISRENYHEK